MFWIRSGNAEAVPENAEGTQEIQTEIQPAASTNEDGIADDHNVATLEVKTNSEDTECEFAVETQKPVENKVKTEN